jgi:20S proteasome subunit alpha 7
MSVGYDFSVTTLSQEGKIYQLEYASKCVEVSSTVFGIVCSDGVILAGEKIINSKTIIAGSNQTLYSVTPNIGILVGGHIPDGRNLVQRAKSEASSYLKNYGIEITGKILSERIASYVSLHTLYWHMRPFGSVALISSYDQDENNTWNPHLYMIESNGTTFEYYACAQGKGRQFMKNEAEKNNFQLRKGTCKDTIYDVIKLLIRSFEGEKETEYDISVVSKDTQGKHQILGKSVLNELVTKARLQVEEDRKMQVD